MKKSLMILFTCILATFAQAQEHPFQLGTTVANAGIGVGTSLGGLGTARPAISVSLDHGLWELGGPGIVSLGGYLGTTGYKYTDLGYTAKWNYFVVGMRGAYHYNGFTNLPKLDAYGGVMLGYNKVKYTSNGTDANISDNYGSGLGFSGFLGGRWFFTEQFGAYAELGFGVSVLNIGASIKF